jgi:asparagine synthase (glutamine-hydrolysing)
MGAIVGVFATVPQTEVEEMVRRLAHRGRAAHVTRCGSDLTMATIGSEPLTGVARRGELTIVYDGALFNVDAIAARLGERGGRANTDAPAELILALYQTFGPRGLEVIAGNFAFALVDQQRREIVLGRDYFGCAPLFYTVLPKGGVAFASEYKALLALSAVDPKVDRDMLQYLQCAKKLPLERTLLSNVQAVPPGGILTVDLSGRCVATHRFPPLQVETRITSESDGAEQLRVQLRNAVQRASQDVDRIGVALSGGIDSIAIAFLLREMHPEKEIHTFTAGHGPGDPELQTAARVAAAICAIHHEVITPPDLLQKSLRRLVWHIEDPYGQSDTLQLFAIGQAASTRVPVLFSGQGADSLFAGMPRYKLLWLMQRLPFPRQYSTEFYNLTQLGLKPRSVVGKALDWAYFQGKVPDVPTVLGARNVPEPIELPPMRSQFVNLMMARGFQSGQCQDMSKYERSFASVAIEYRCPYCDLDFARFAYTISDALKIRYGRQKYILRKALRSVVPDEFLQVPKFMQRMKYDEAFSSTLEALCADVLAKEAVEKRGFFQYSEIRKLLDRPSRKPYGPAAAMRLWTVLCTEIWAQEFLDKRGRGPGGAMSLC